MIILQKIIARIKKGYEPMEYTPRLPKDFDEAFTAIYKKSSPYTMTSPERMHALYKAIHYVVQNKINGDIVECGVWRGGSSMITALTLKNLKDIERSIYLYDTYKGMSKPTEKDRVDAMEKWERRNNPSFNEWCYAPLEDVRRNMFSTQYPQDKLIFVEGEVEQTIPSNIPEKISVLRLDTDWYQSTYHELVHLYPKLTRGGVLIIDDYGHHEGARRAVDKYFEENNIHPYFARIDYTCRVVIKNT